MKNLPRDFRHALEPGDAADGIKRDVARADAEAPSHQGVSELVQDHAGKKQHKQQGRIQRPGTRLNPPAGQGDEGQ